MSSELENLDGLGELLSKGYSLALIGGHLVVNDVWYVDEAGELGRGHLAAPLSLIAENRLGAPYNHQMFWSGERPFYADGTAIPSLGNAQAQLSLGGTKFLWHFSNKPPEGFSSYEPLVEHYVTLISAPAQDKFGVSPLTSAIYDVPPETSPFRIRDTFSSRAELTDLNKKLAGDRVAIIGLGGTGAFVLDFLVKTPVFSIEGFDFDTFEVHNGFRSPGEVPFDMFGHSKAAFYRRKYDSFRHRLRFHEKRVSSGDEGAFDGITFAFVCIDDGESRGQICEMLNKLKIPFIDVGMGVEKEGGVLDGLLRTTFFDQDNWERALNDVPLDRRVDDGAYRVFVQIAELNALNAAIAVIKYKQIRGFYSDVNGYYNTLLSIGSANWVGEA